jgi:hypothetical protein
MYARKDGEEKEIAYWRKHNALHNWMEQHWTPEDVFPQQEFNCVEMRITMPLLLQLREDIRNHRLKPTEGFFFGTTDYDPAEHAEEDLNFLRHAENLLLEGWDVYYNSWW